MHISGFILELTYSKLRQIHYPSLLSIQMIKRVIVSLAILFGILLLTLPSTDEKSVARIASGSMLMCTKEFRGQVEQQVLRDEPVTAEFSNTCPDLIATLEVSETGEMVITGSKHPLTMTLTPAIENGKVMWSCSGEPETSITKLCKPR